jgi:hypothetical protein
LRWIKVPLVGCGSLTLLWGGLFVCTGLGMVLDPLPDATRFDGVVAGGICGGFPLFVGAISVSLGLVMARRDRVDANHLAWIATRDRFTAAEFAQAVGRSPADAEARLYALLQLPSAPQLLFHRASHGFVRRGALAAEARVVESCPSCGSRERQLLLPGEVARCGHCGAGL